MPHVLTRAQIKDRFQGRSLSAYGLTILEALITGNPNIQPEDTHQIEEIMRTQHSTLDGLDFRKLKSLARHSWKVLQELRKDGVYETPEYGGTFTPGCA